MDLAPLSDERIRAMAAPFLPDGTPNPFQTLDPVAAERYIAGRGDRSNDPVTAQARKRAAELLELADDPDWLGI